MVCSGVAGSVQEAKAVTNALCIAGVVLRFRAQVYLRPDEVAHSVLSVRFGVHQQCILCLLLLHPMALVTIQPLTRSVPMLLLVMLNLVHV